MDNGLLKQYLSIRQQTEALCKPLVIEDFVIQGMADVSPPKWHLAHTTWFFETFILKNNPGYIPFNTDFHHLFNSYYQSLGPFHTREKRGLLSRPQVKTIYAYRSYVDEQITIFFSDLSEDAFEKHQKIMQLGIEHERQHQELLLMDIKYNFFLNAEMPVYHNDLLDLSPIPTDNTLIFEEVGGGLMDIGYEGEDFCFDNELPRHSVYISPFSISNRLITNGEYLHFMEDGGYENPLLWLSDGYDWVNLNQIKSPLYWQKKDDQWMEYTFSGNQVLNPDTPVSHISFFEADAFARWVGHRLAYETEWEHYVKLNQFQPENGNFIEKELFQPLPASLMQDKQFFGDLWEWTISAYLPYPGYQPFPEHAGEYNSKFTNNQRVLRGGSFATSSKHIRTSYRNFFQPDKRWQFSGIRLASNLQEGL